MKIAVVTLYDDNARSYGEITAAGKERYCQHWGYTFRKWTTVIDPTHAPSWSKIDAVLSVMEELPDVTHIFWSDADALIFYPNVRLESFIDERYQLHISNEPEGMNCGNWIIRNSPWAKNVLSNLRKYVWEGDQLWEQDALHHYLNANVSQRAHIKHMGSAFNAYPNQPRGFMLHVTSTGHAERFQIIRDAARYIVWPTQAH